MKQILQILLATLILPTMLFSCGGSDNDDNPTTRPLVLSVDKASIKGDGVEEATFTVMRGNVDVTAQASVCIVDDVCLTSNVFKTRDAGVYRFYATLLSGDGKKSNEVTVTVTPSAPDEDAFDASKTLHKNLGLFTFTDSWCIPCSDFIYVLESVVAQHPDNIVHVDMFIETSEPEVASDLPFTFRPSIEDEGGFELTGVPTCFADLRTKVLPRTPQFINSIYDARLAEPVKTGIRVNSVIEGGQINVEITVGAKEADTYFLSAMLVEDNIISSRYEHPNFNNTDVFRDIATSSIYGESIGALAAGQTTTRNYSFEMKSKYKPANLSLVVYTLYKEGERRVVSNIVKAPANNFTDFKYVD